MRPSMFLRLRVTCKLLAERYCDSGGDCYTVLGDDRSWVAYSEFTFNTTDFYVNCALIANSWEDAQFNGADAQIIANESGSNFILQKS